jgi:hypothetical protein
VVFLKSVGHLREGVRSEKREKEERDGELQSFGAFELLSGVFRKKQTVMSATPWREVNWRRA